MSKTTRDVIETYAGRDGLSRGELLALNQARRAAAPTTERIERNGWTVELAHHAHTHGGWSVTAWRSGTVYGSQRCLASGPGDVTEATARRVADAFLDTPGDVTERYAAARAARVAS